MLTAPPAGLGLVLVVRGVTCTRGGAARAARGQTGDEGGELGVVGLTAHDPHVGRRHSGMFPCFLDGSPARLVRRARSARTTCTRVLYGATTAST